MYKKCCAKQKKLLFCCAPDLTKSTRTISSSKDMWLVMASVGPLNEAVHGETSVSQSISHLLGGGDEKLPP